MTEINNFIYVKIADETIKYSKDRIQRMPACQVETISKQLNSSEDRKKLNSWINESHGE